MLKEQIRNNLYRRDGKLNTAVLRRQEFLESELCADINSAIQDIMPIDSTWSKKIYYIMNDIIEVQKCERCGSDLNFTLTGGARHVCPNLSCVQKHSRPKRNATMQAKYGALVSPDTITAAKSRLSEFAIKGNLTKLQRYGTTNTSSLSSVKLKVRQTMLERYGATSMNNTPEGQYQIQTSRLSRWKEKAIVYDVDVTSVSRRSDKLLFEIEYTCLKCNTHQTMLGETFKWRCDNNISPCDDCCGIKFGSSSQHAVTEYCKLHTDKEVEVNKKRILNDKWELDIYIEELAIAIEYDGLFWHSYNRNETPDERRKHLDKTTQCLDKGIKLIHIFEHEWVKKPDIVKSRLRSLMGSADRIYARQCTIVELTTKEARQWFEATHIQGFVGQVICYGLQYKGELVAAMSFGKPRFSAQQWELLRYSTKLYHTVVGGPSKLFQKFVREHNPTSVVSYADRRWSPSPDSVYKQLGFQYTHSSKPGYFYTNASTLTVYNRVKFQKHKLKAQLNTFDEALTEAENMFNNGYRRIWDCGNNVFVWEPQKL